MCELTHKNSYLFFPHDLRTIYVIKITWITVCVFDHLHFCITNFIYFSKKILFIRYLIFSKIALEIINKYHNKNTLIVNFFDFFCNEVDVMDACRVFWWKWNKVAKLSSFCRGSTSHKICRSRHSSRFDVFITLCRYKKCKMY